MWKASARCLLVIAAAAQLTCAPESLAEDRALLVKRIPAAVSAEAAWALFDRSIESGLASPPPTVTVTLDEPAEIAAVKVYGPAPFELRVTGPAGAPLGLPPIDLSGLSRGWHAFPAVSPSRISAVELHFAPTSGEGAVPELELWGFADEPRQYITSLSAESLPSTYSATPTHSRVDIESGECAVFPVTLERRPELFRRAFITYQASGVLRGFGIAGNTEGDLVGPRAQRPRIDLVHHLGGSDARQPAAAVLAQFGIGINDAANGVFLPATRASLNMIGATVHSTVHTRAYYQHVNEMLRQVTSRQEALEVLDALRQVLLTGAM